jgi:hypothetical protein
MRLVVPNVKKFIRYFPPPMLDGPRLCACSQLLISNGWADWSDLTQIGMHFEQVHICSCCKAASIKLPSRFNHVDGNVVLLIFSIHPSLHNTHESLLPSVCLAGKNKINRCNA